MPKKEVANLSVSELGSSESPALLPISPAVSVVPLQDGLQEMTEPVSQSQSETPPLADQIRILDQTELDNDLIQAELAGQIAAASDWPTLAKVINDWAQWKGWNDKPVRSTAVALLFKSEVAEAFEEARKDRYAVYYSEDSNGHQKPEGVYTEVADLAIRILHYCGLTTADQGSWWNNKTTHYTIKDWNDFIEVAWALDSSCWVSVDAMRDALAICKLYLENAGQSLSDLVKEKMQYNLTRPHRHGGKVL